MGRGFNLVRKEWPWPAHAKYSPFPTGPLTLAPGAPGMHAAYDGRELVLDQLQNITTSTVMLELGVFLGGSMHRWLEGSSAVRVVGVDPFLNVTDYTSAWLRRDRRYAGYAAAIAQLAAPDGSYHTSVAALHEYRERACLIKAFSPRVLPKLHRMGLRPDVVFIDNDKTMHDLWVAHALWPHATLAGDDWGHQAQMLRRSPVGHAKHREFNTTNDAAYNVCSFARKQGFWVQARHVTWVLRRGSPKNGEKDACAASQPRGTLQGWA